MFRNLNLQFTIRIALISKSEYNYINAAKEGQHSIVKNFVQKLMHNGIKLFMGDQKL